MPPASLQNAGRGAQAAIRGAGVQQAGQLVTLERHVRQAEALGQMCALDPLLLLQGADGVDQPAAGAQHGGGRFDQPILPGDQRRQIAGPLDVRQVRMAADGAGGRAGCVQQDGVQRRVRPPIVGVGLDDLGAEMQPRQVLAQARHPTLAGIDGQHVGAGGGELGGLAAGGGAQIGHAFTRPGGEQAGGPGGGGVLHPEIARGQAGQVRHPRAGRQADGAAGQRHAAFRRRRAGLDGQVQRRFLLVRGGNGARLGAPGGPEPVRCVQARRVQAVQHRTPALGHTAQHGVDQPGERRELLRARQLDAGGHRGMGRRVQQQKLGGAQAEDEADGIRRGALEVRLEHRIQRAGPAQDGGGQAVGGGPVPRLAGDAVQRLVERSALVDDGAQELQGRRGGWGPLRRLMAHGALA